MNLKDNAKEVLMYTIYRINANELDGRFVRALKAMFKNKEIEIAVCEVTEIEEDETAYLLKSPANRERLLKAIENVAQNRNLVTVNLDELE
jgi:antitoxin YefM